MKLETKFIGRMGFWWAFGFGAAGLFLLWLSGLPLKRSPALACAVFFVFVAMAFGFAIGAALMKDAIDKLKREDVEAKRKLEADIKEENHV